MKVRNATIEELIADGTITSEDASLIEEYSQMIEEDGELPPAEYVSVQALGRPKKFGESLVHINTRITASQREFIDKYATQTNVSVSDVVREAIELLRAEHGEPAAA